MATTGTQLTSDQTRMLRHTNLDLTMQYVERMAKSPAQARRHAMLRHTSLDLTMQYLGAVTAGKNVLPEEMPA